MQEVVKVFKGEKKISSQAKERLKKKSLIWDHGCKISWPKGIWGISGLGWERSRIQVSESDVITHICCLRRRWRGSSWWTTPAGSTPSSRPTCRQPMASSTSSTSQSWRLSLKGRLGTNRSGPGETIPWGVKVKISHMSHFLCPVCW